jgi:hypothetical protein
MKTTTTNKIFRFSFFALAISAFFAIVMLFSCNKEPQNVAMDFLKKPSSHSSDVLDKWMTLQLRLMRNATGIPNQAFSRHFAYSGIAAYESLEPGLTGNSKWLDNWNGLTGLPVPDPSKKYFYPANVNAALASINKAMFPNASTVDKAAIDSLEAALKQEFLTEETESIVNASAAFGKAVAQVVFNWSETDGYKNAGAPYTIQVGTGLWKPTPPAFANPSTPYWGNNRTIINGSLSNTIVSGLPSYSTDPTSPYYQMVKEVYDASFVLTTDQKAMAVYWRDVPGVTSPGHWVSILQQVIKQKQPSLDKGALAYALAGTAMNDALIRTFQIKYQTLVVRPVTYVRGVIGDTAWSSFIGTPPHPEYLSAHSSLSMAAAVVLETLFGANQSITDHTYDYMNLGARTYSSYTAIAAEAGLSRLYAGIHYRKSIDDGLFVGRKVAENIFQKQTGHQQDQARISK